MIAAASLSRLSPSTSRQSRAGAPTSRKIPTTAPVSVVATIDASSRHATSDTSATGATASPITAVATRTATTARSRIGATSSIIRFTSIVSAAWKRSAGTNTNMNVSDVTGTSTNARATSPATPVAPSRRASMAAPPMVMPITAKRIDAGSATRAARRCRRLTTTSRPATTRRMTGRLIGLTEL